MSNKKQTAVEWLYYELWKQTNFSLLNNILEQSKEMEKQQIIDAYCDGFYISAEGFNGEYGLKNIENISEEIEAEQYYKETYDN
jgi:hypothetical protein